ncbi:MAG: glycosyltransferase family 39 protein [Acidobacteriota bacterium]|jgi:4-amino-4-deoxy-L-arabinose transferase-like glycosyltransferase|nr:glycosyltransferase family 39 protein [Acidobacteriota bacterium]
MKHVRFWLPLALTAIVYLGVNTGRGVIDYDEGYYAQPALRMAEVGDWITPYADGVRFLEKPPLLYWVTAASFKALGVGESALRLPTALAVVALAGVVTLTARLVVAPFAAALAGLSAAFSVGTFLFTRETLHDVWLVLFLAVAMYAFLKWRLTPSRPLGAALLFYAALAGGVMCKSLVGLAFPLGVALLFFLWNRELPAWRTLHLLPGLLLFLLLAVPWHWLAAVHNEGFLDFFFVKEQFLRFLGRREPPVLWSVPVVNFWALVLVWFFPWIAFVPAAFAGARQADGESGGSTRLLRRLAVAWLAVVLGFFTFSARLEHYAFPALPAFALLVALAFDRVAKARDGGGGACHPAEGRSGKALAWGYRALAAAGVLALVFGVAAAVWLSSGDALPANSAGPADRLAENDFSIMAEMPPEVVRGLLAPAAATVAALAAGFPLALFFFSGWRDGKGRWRGKAAALTVVAVMALVCAMAHWSLVVCEDLISSKGFGLALAAQARPGDRLVVVGDYESANSLNFYQPLRVEVVEGTAYALLPGLRYPDAPPVLMASDEFKKLWASASRVFVLLPEARRKELTPDGVTITRRLHRVLVKNR